MANWHLEELQNALTAKGWQVIAEWPGDDRCISGSWEIQRSTRRPTLVVDFDGLDDMQCLPLAESYACTVRSHPDVSLYFRKRHSRNHWLPNLQDFIGRIEEIARELDPVINQP